MAYYGVSAMIQPSTPDKKHTKEFTLYHTLTKDFFSKINGIKYNLYISLPKEYASNNADYPIIYLLDADYSFALARQKIKQS
jgi:predicted alpha/beta superfamily hydrolase